MSDLGWFFLPGETLLEALERVQQGHEPALVFAQLYANSDVTTINEGDDL